MNIEQCCQILEILFVVLHQSRNILCNVGPKRISYPLANVQPFIVELYNPGASATGYSYAHNKLAARSLKPKHFATYYGLFDRLDREYGKIFDMKTGRMYPEAKEKYWPDLIDNIGITEPDYVNPRLKPENWRTDERSLGKERGYPLRDHTLRGVGMCDKCEGKQRG